MGMACKSFTIRTRKFLTNKLLSRTQFVLDILHPNGSNISKEEIRNTVANLYSVPEVKQVIVWGLKTAFGGGRTIGLGLIYDSLYALQRFKPRYRQLKYGMINKVSHSRKQIKERKNRAKKTRGSSVKK